MLNELDILDALRACYDPAGPYRGLDIVDLGLVEQIVLKLDPDAPGAGIPGVPPRQALALTLLSATLDADAQAQLQAQIANRLSGLAELSCAEIRFATSPPWTQARISPGGRRILNLDFPILNNAGVR